MTEKAKMLAGQPYQAWDQVLLSERQAAKAICHAFNHDESPQISKRIMRLANLMAIKGQAHIEPDFYCDYGYNISLGDNFYANHHLTILDACPVTIGDNALIGPHVVISTASHPLDPIERRNTELAQPIHIGDDVWIGANVSILGGVNIGNNCVIGAGSVVNKDIPDNSVAVGNPCKVIKSIY